MCYLQNHHSTHFNHNIIWSILIGCIDPLYWSGELIHCFDRVHWSMLIHCFDRVHRPMFFWSSALICDAEIEWKHYQSINQSINQSTNFQVSHSLFIVVIYWHDGFCLAKNVVHIHIDITKVYICRRMKGDKDMVFWSHFNVDKCHAQHLEREENQCMQNNTPWFSYCYA